MKRTWLSTWLALATTASCVRAEEPSFAEADLDRAPPGRDLPYAPETRPLTAEELRSITSEDSPLAPYYPEVVDEAPLADRVRAAVRDRSAHGILLRVGAMSEDSRGVVVEAEVVRGPAHLTSQRRFWVPAGYSCMAPVDLSVGRTFTAFVAEHPAPAPGLVALETIVEHGGLPAFGVLESRGGTEVVAYAGTTLAVEDLVAAPEVVR